MNEPTLEKITAELAEKLSGQKLGKIFALAKYDLSIDFRLRNGEYLFISVKPNSPRIYLIKRRLKELEKASLPQTSFVALLRKKVSNAIVQSAEKIEDERIIKISLSAKDEFGVENKFTLLIQLTGRSSNLFLLDENDRILDSLRETFGKGQEIAEKYSVPLREEKQKNKAEWKVFPLGHFETLSEALDKHYSEKEEHENFESKVRTAQSGIRKELKKQKNLRKKLEKDLRDHGDADKWKKFGDLLLANAWAAERKGDKISVVDYFDEDVPKIEIEIDENQTITQNAEKYFKRYTKARNAKKEISKRLAIIEKNIKKSEKTLEKIEKAITLGDLKTIETFLPKKKKRSSKNKNKCKENSSYYRKFISSDGFEILVGKRSKDNDFLTFRVAGSLDTWMHAADYPGSHVVIKNPNRKEIPHRTLIEAAQLAAFYSKAKNESKAAVHYTQKKFVNKPKGAAAGLVSLASFKTILVKPKISVQKKDG